MRALPLSIGTIHFVGIGGIGMSGIAEVLHNLGYAVQGSDIADSVNVRRLRDAGIAVSIGHDAENLGVEGLDLGAELSPKVGSHRSCQNHLEHPLVVERQATEEIFCRVHRRRH